MEAPRIISQQMMCVKTYYDKMDAEERQSVFSAYSYDQRKQTYHLIKPELLNYQTIKKLN